MLKSYASEITVTFADGNIKTAVAISRKRSGGYYGVGVYGLKELRFDKFYGDCVRQVQKMDMLRYGGEDSYELTYRRTNYRGDVEYTYISVETIELSACSTSTYERLEANYVK